MDAKSGPLEASDFGEIGDFRRNRPACNGENGETGEKSPASGDLNLAENGSTETEQIWSHMGARVTNFSLSLHVLNKKKKIPQYLFSDLTAKNTFLWMDMTPFLTIGLVFEMCF